MALHILSPGALTTIQDEGRWGYQHLGVPVGGPMDRASHRLANLLVGNTRLAATLEVTLVGPTIEFDRDTVFAVAGAEFDLALDGAPVPSNTACRASKGSRLRFGRRRRGARAYLAAAGGLATPALFGSRATHLPSRMGGLDGRPLVAGDALPIGNAGGARRLVGRSRRPAFELPPGGARVRVMLGPQEDMFTEVAITTLRMARYVIALESDRMGYRLAGPRLEHGESGDTLSDATPVGTIQVPASGQPILLMADCQTAGGYPKIATVITADLPVAGQLAPGEFLEFDVCDRPAAVAALDAQERLLTE